MDQILVAGSLARRPNIQCGADVGEFCPMQASTRRESDENPQEPNAVQAFPDLIQATAFVFTIFD